MFHHHHTVRGLDGLLDFRVKRLDVHESPCGNSTL
jgi:hypothetical protein